MTTLYLKYRPQKISELDLTEVREMLSKIVSFGDIPHAFLFEGPRGSGKTSAARIIAKILNCEHLSKDNEPCNTCSQCISITKGNNIDVIELDAASHRGINDVRLIRESVKLSPAKAKRKIYIIDEAHMLTTEASNALLKTLEEPPPHVYFILATTNPEKLIDTIKSRTVRVVFKKATTAEIVKSLKNVLQKEKKKYGDSVLDLVSRSVDGSFRDAKKLLEELLVKDAVNDLEKAQNYILSKSSFDVENLFDKLFIKDLKGCIQLLNRAEGSSVPSKTVIYQILGKLKGMLFSAIEYKKDASVKFEKEEIYNLTDVFLTYWKKYQNDVSEFLPLYLAVVKWCGESNNKDDNKDKIHGSVHINSPGSEGKDKVNEKKNLEDETNSFIKYTKEESKLVKNFSDEVWKEILLKVRNRNTSTEALLRASKPANFNGSILSLGVFYKFHKEKLESLPHKRCLEDSLKDVLGNEVKVECFLTDPHSYIKNEDTALTKEAQNTDIAGTASLESDSSVVLKDVADLDIEKLADEVFGS